MQDTTTSKTSTPNARATDGARARAHADAAIAKWRTASTLAKAARSQFNAAAGAAEKARGSSISLSPETRLPLIDLEVRAIEADHEATVCEREATAKLDIAEVVEGDALAVGACDLEQLHADLINLLAEEERTRAVHAIAKQRIWDRIGRARKDSAGLDARRRAGALPPPARIPSPGSLFGDEPRLLIEALARKEEAAAVTMNAVHAANINKLRQKEVEIRAALEREQIARDEHAAEVAEAARNGEAGRLADEKRQRKEHDAQNARLRAHREETEALAAAHRARSA